MRLTSALLIGILCLLSAVSGYCDERFPISLLDAYAEPIEGALIVVFDAGGGSPVDTAYEQGSGMYWFQVDSDSGWVPGYYDVYINGVLDDAWSSVYLGFGNVPALDSVDSTRVKDGSLSGKDIAPGLVDSKQLADSVSFSICRSIDWLIADDWTKLLGSVWLGDAPADTVRLKGTLTSSNTTQDGKVRIWHSAETKTHNEVWVGAGYYEKVYVDSTGPTAIGYYVTVDDSIMDPSSSGFYYVNYSDSATGQASWNYGANAGIYSQNFHAQGHGMLASADIGYALGVQLNEYGDGIHTYVLNAWGDAWHMFSDVEDSTSAMWIDMDGPSTEGIRIDRNGGGYLCGSALSINNQDGDFRCFEIYNTETAGTIFSIRGEQSMIPYAGSPPGAPGDSAIVDIRVGAAVGGSAATHSGIRLVGTSAGGKPPVRILDRGTTGNGGALKVECAASSGNAILATLKGGISWLSGLYTRSAWYDAAAPDSIQWAGLDTIWDGNATDTLYIGNLAATDIIFALRQNPSLLYYAPGDIQIFNDSANSRVIVIRAESTPDMPYAWLRIRNHQELE